MLFLWQNQSVNGNILRQKWDSMCVLGGRRGFKMCSVVRQITCWNILRSIINDQVHCFAKILPQNHRESIEISGVWIVYDRSDCPGEACLISTLYKSGFSSAMCNSWLELMVWDWVGDWEVVSLCPISSPIRVSKSSAQIVCLFL